MVLDWLKEPLSEDTPCGPDLEQADDPEFVEYYFEAEGRLPERYFIPGMRSGRDGEEGSDDKLFDPKSVDIKKERATIDGLLKRSRDLRLLSLMARWEVLAGRTTGFADAIAGMADLLEAFPEAVHPVIAGSNSDRRGAIDNLATPVTSVIPLQYVSLTGEADVTFRLYQVATGTVTARAGESEATSSGILDALKNDGNKAKVTKTQDDLTRAADGLDRIKRACKAHPDKPMSLNFEDLMGMISQMQDLIQLARPDLSGWDSAGAAAAAEVEDTPTAEEPAPASDADSGGSDAQAAAAVAVGEAGPAGEITGQNAAKVTLQAVEGYLRSKEPSSAALLLVTQARLLIGKPLIEALETLLPEESRRAIVDFGPATGFALNMDRLRALSGEAPGIAVEEEPDPTPPKLTTRADVASHIRSVENYFRGNEPTSPVPTLLVRARSYLDKDFDAIVAELIPMAPKEDN